MRKRLRQQIAVDKSKEVDDDVASVADVMIGDYLSLVAEKNPKFLNKFRVGVRKICAAFNIDPKGLDIDGLM